MTLGEYIKTFRKKHGYTSQEFADLCGVSQTYISFIENEKKQSNTGKFSTPSIKIVNKIANGLGISVGEAIFMLEGKKPELEKIITTPYAVSVGERIRLARERRNMTRKELASKVGLTEDNIIEYERGTDRSFNLELMLKFCEILNVSNSYFIDYTQPVESIGKNIYILRLLLEDTITNVAEGTGLEEEDIEEIENGGAITFEQISAIANYFGIPEGMLIIKNFSLVERHTHEARMLKLLSLSAKLSDRQITALITMCESLIE